MDFMTATEYEEMVSYHTRPPNTWTQGSENCRYCDGTASLKNKQTVTEGYRQDYQCKKCGVIFILLTPSEGADKVLIGQRIDYDPDDEDKIRERLTKTIIAIAKATPPKRRAAMEWKWRTIKIRYGSAGRGVNVGRLFNEHPHEWGRTLYFNLMREIGF